MVPDKNFECPHSPWECHNTWESFKKNFGQSDSVKERLDLYLVFILMFVFAAALIITLFYHCYKLCDCLRFRQEPVYRACALLPHSSYAHHQNILSQHSHNRISNDPLTWSQGFQRQAPPDYSCVSFHVVQEPLQLPPYSNNLTISNLNEGQGQLYRDFDLSQDCQVNEPPPSYAEALLVNKCVQSSA